MPHPLEIKMPFSLAENGISEETAVHNNRETILEVERSLQRDTPDSSAGRVLLTAKLRRRSEVGRKQRAVRSRKIFVVEQVLLDRFLDLLATPLDGVGFRSDSRAR